MLKQMTVSIDVEDLSLGGAEQAVSDGVDRLIGLLPAGARVIGIVQAAGPFHHSVPAEDSYRDYHYSDRGLVVCFIYEV